MTLNVAKPVNKPIIISDEKEAQILHAYSLLHTALFDYTHNPANIMKPWTGDVSQDDLKNDATLDRLDTRARIALNVLADHRENERVAAFRGSVESVLSPYISDGQEAMSEYNDLSDRVKKLMPKMVDYVTVPMVAFKDTFEGQNEAQATKILVSLGYKVGKKDAATKDTATYVFAPLTAPASK